jgi:hypothetical protein
MKTASLLLTLAVLTGSLDSALEQNLKLAEEQQFEMEDAIQVFSRKANAVHTKNREQFLQTIDTNNREYYYEQFHWFTDVESNPIENYTLDIQNIEPIDINTQIVTLTQRYRFQGRDYETTYKTRLVHTPEGWRDGDLAFNSKETEHFIICYFDEDAALADRVAEEAEVAYAILAERIGDTPQDKTVIKLYNDKELLRQSVKLSFAWQFGGWYEYPESIKVLSTGSENRVFIGTIMHELTHKITLGWAKNNLPYWFSEGLAVHYSGYDGLTSGTNYIPVAELEKINLEILTDRKQISDYYNVSANVVRYIATAYGEDKLKALVRELANFPSSAGTIAEVDKDNIAKFREAVPRVLGVPFDQFDQNWQAFIKSQLQSQ